MGQGEMTSVNRVVFHIVAPPWPKPRDQRLPPMLRSSQPASVPGYSKGAWGLSVLLRVDGIFTATSISPSLRSRQRPSRYAVHARRNLPDKELRSLILINFLKRWTLPYSESSTEPTSEGFVDSVSTSDNLPVKTRIRSSPCGVK